MKIKNIILLGILTAIIYMAPLSAHALFEPFRSNRVVPNQWTANFAGETTLDRVNVIATIESMDQEVSLTKNPNSPWNTVLPMQPIYKKIYRISFTPNDQPKIRVSYTLRKYKGSDNGENVDIFLSADNNSEFTFKIVSQPDGNMKAQYARKLSPGIMETGSFFLEPLLSVMNE